MKLEATQVNGSRGYGDIFIYTHWERGKQKNYCLGWRLQWLGLEEFLFFLAMYILDSFSWIEWGRTASPVSCHESLWCCRARDEAFGKNGMVR